MNYDAIDEVLRDQLPAALGEELRKVLDQAKEDAERVKRLERVETERDNFARRIIATEALEKELSAKQVNLEQRERNIELREKLIELKEEHCKQRVGDLHGVVLAVFANSRFKYSESGQVPVVRNGYTESAFTSKMIETEE